MAWIDDNDNRPANLPEMPSDPDPRTMRTTNDVQQHAEEARRMYQAAQEETAQAQPDDSGYFDHHMLLYVEIEGSSRPIVLRASEQMLIGRRDPSAGIIPEIDLSSHAGYQLGISRSHAVIRWQNRQLYLLDLGSRNGTYANGNKVDTQQGYKLHDGDILRLGKMTLRIFFRQENNAAQG